ncbi:MAG: flagellar basal body rod protein FlgB [Planctomycetota bacterium]
MDELSRDMTLLSRMLDAASMRTRVIAHNMANVNTPGYTRSVVAFEDALGAALKGGRQDSAEQVRPEIKEEPGGRVKPDGNNVQMEDEMADLVKATILYNTMNRIMSGRIGGLRIAISGR